MVPESLNDFLGVDDGDDGGVDKSFILSHEREDKEPNDVECGKYIFM